MLHIGKPFGKPGRLVILRGTVVSSSRNVALLLYAGYGKLLAECSLFFCLSEESREQGRSFYKELIPHLLFRKAKEPLASVTPWAIEVTCGHGIKETKDIRNPLCSVLSLACISPYAQNISFWVTDYPRVDNLSTFES